MVHKNKITIHLMKKLFFYVTSLFMISFAKADTNISLKDYLESKDIRRRQNTNIFIK